MPVPHYTSNVLFCHKPTPADSENRDYGVLTGVHIENYSNRWEPMEPAGTSFVPAAKLFPLAAGMSVCVFRSVNLESVRMCVFVEGGKGCLTPLLDSH